MSNFIREIVSSSEMGDAIVILPANNTLETLRLVCIQLEIHFMNYYWSRYTNFMFCMLIQLHPPIQAPIERKPRAPSKCSKCGQVGHIASNKTCSQHPSNSSSSSSRQPSTQNQPIQEDSEQEEENDEDDDEASVNSAIRNQLEEGGGDEDEDDDEAMILEDASAWMVHPITKFVDETSRSSRSSSNVESQFKLPPFKGYNHGRGNFKGANKRVVEDEGCKKDGDVLPFFMLFLTSDIMKTFVVSINTYARLFRSNYWTKDIDLAEFKAFIAIILELGVVFLFLRRSF